MPFNALAILLGVCLAFWGNRLPDLFWASWLPALLWLIYCQPRYRFVLAILFAYLWASILLQFHLDSRLQPELDNQARLVQGVIDDLPVKRTGKTTILLKVEKIEGFHGQIPDLIRVNWYRASATPQAGERWQFDIRLKRPDGLLNPAGFDFSAWQFVKGYGARGYVLDSGRNRKLSNADYPSIHRWRGQLNQIISEDCSSCFHAGVIKALVLGFRADIEPRKSRLLQDSGTIHLIAISGLHVGLVGGLFFMLGRWLWRFGFISRQVSRNSFACGCAVVAVTVYAALAGFSIPTMRALLMFAILFAGLIFRQKISLLQSLCLAVVVVVLIDPRSVGSLSFWLSISAVMVICFVQFRWPGRKMISSLVLMQLAFSILLIPLGMFFFGQVSPAGFLANLVAIPMISFGVLPLVLLGSILASFGLKAAAGLLQLGDFLLDLLMQYLEILMSRGFDAWQVASWPAMLILLSLISCLFFLLPAPLMFRKFLLPVGVMMVFWEPSRPAAGEYELVVFDVGMGTSIFLQTRHHSLIFDFGPGRAGGFSAAEWGLKPWLKAKNINNPDMLIVSHSDQDHSGGLHAFDLSSDSNLLLSGTPQRLKSRFPRIDDVRSCHQFSNWRWDGVDFRFLTTPLKKTSSTNNRSCVLQVAGHHDALLPGDVEFRQEQHLLREYGPDLASDILIVPHHGSGTSSSLPFVNRTSPEISVFTLSRNNRWGFPDQAVVARYEEISSRIYRTDINGSVLIKSTREGVRVDALSPPAKRLWRRW
ncbi:MAG: DNA internalization-related competence protein ComEC/Rec2 [Pseudomonadota bacterium]